MTVLPRHYLPHVSSMIGVTNGRTRAYQTGDLVAHSVSLTKTHGYQILGANSSMLTVEICLYETFKVCTSINMHRRQARRQRPTTSKSQNAEIVNERSYYHLRRGKTVRCSRRFHATGQESLYEEGDFAADQSSSEGRPNSQTTSMIQIEQGRGLIDDALATAPGMALSRAESSLGNVHHASSKAHEQLEARESMRSLNGHQQQHTSANDKDVIDLTVFDEGDNGMVEHEVGLNAAKVPGEAIVR